jgi:DNA-binding NtrC family response regulator
VDDEEKIAEVLEKFLQKQGFEMTKLFEARQAIELLKTGALFDLLITDMKMPGFTGLDLLKAKKEMKNDTPVLLLTGSIDAEKYFENGMLQEVGCAPEDVCYKPVDLFSLLKSVKRKLKME